MKLTHDDHEKVINTLKTAYHDHDTPEVDGQWQQNVMRDIRRLGPLGLPTNNATFLAQLLWRAAPAVCMLLLIIGAFLVNLDFVSDFELGTLLTEDPFTSMTIDSFFM